MKLIILGAPGSGKGTQAKLLAEKFHLHHISSAVLHAEIQKGTSLGKKIHTSITKGELVPNHLANPLYKKNIPKDHFILDGAPRDLVQARYLHHVFTPDHIIFLNVPVTVLKKRLLKRALLEGREDDTPAVIARRIHVYHTKTEPVLRYYKKKLLTIDGNQKPEKIFRTLLQRLR